MRRSLALSINAPLLIAMLMLSSQAQALTGQEYVDKCNPKALSSQPSKQQAALEQALDAGSCTGFTGGVVQGINFIGTMLRAQQAITKNFICLNNEVHALGLVEVAYNHIKASEKLLGMPAQAGIYEALVSAYPCTAK